MLKDEKRKNQFKYKLGRLMGEYAVPLPLGNFNLDNKETRRLELWKNRRGVWIDHASQGCLGTKFYVATIFSIVICPSQVCFHVWRSS